jgi:hypothetical protein
MVRTHRLDAIVAPTGGTPWLTDFANGDHFSGRFLDCRRRCRLSAPDGAGRIPARIAGRDLIFWWSLDGR